MTDKAIIFDSGTLISFSMNGLLDLVKKLKGIFNGKFLITSQVKEEIIDKPIKIKRFELEALRIKQLLDQGVLELTDAIGVKQTEVDKKTKEILDIANNTFISDGKGIHIIDSGEASCLALSKILDQKKIKNVIAVDERTTRILGEKPENLKKLLGKRLHTNINPKPQNFRFFGGFNFIRYAELVYVAYKKGLVDLKDGELVLDALLYAMKFKGCAISGDEIREIEKLK